MVGRVNTTGVDWEDSEQVKEHRNKTNSIRFKKNKIKAFEYLGGFKCHNPECKHNPEYFDHIDFHHQIPENKTRKLSWIFRHCTWKRVKQEIDDADVIPLCKFCHVDIERTYTPQPLYTEGELE